MDKNNLGQKSSSEIIETDILIIGGGTAGCMAAVEAKEQDPELEVVIVEKADIERSGCLAAGVNALNAHINPGETPESFVKHVRREAIGVVREDLVKTMAEEINPAVQRVETWGMQIKKSENGEYRTRGRWGVKIDGESLKPVLAKKVRESKVNVLNHVTAVDLMKEDEEIVGAYGFGLRDGEFYVIKAKATIITTGGAAGLYKPNNTGLAHHKMWYCPFNTGAGYAMGIRAGAEMTSFEMRFIALRTKDAIAPTGTLAIGFGADKINARGEPYMQKYGDWGGHDAPTPIRVWATVKEMKEGRGPCVMDTTNLNEEEVDELKESYLNMYPGLILYWAANNLNPGEEPIEICGTEPYVVGGHCQAGYWINEDRSTTLPGLFAAGDVAGGAPYKFVTGCWAEGVIAARSAAEYIEKKDSIEEPTQEQIQKVKERTYAPLERHESGKGGVTPQEVEARLQKIMDEYAGGISTYYEMNEGGLTQARKKLAKLKEQLKYLIARDPHELMLAHDVIDRIDVAQVLVEHLLYRKETRWPVYQSRLDYPARDDDNWRKFVNSRVENGEITMIERPYEKLVEGDYSLPQEAIK